MADPVDPTANLPQMVTRFVPRGPTLYGNPGQLVPVTPPVNNFVSRQPTGAQGYTTGNPTSAPLVIATQAPSATPSAPAPQSPAALTNTAQPAPNTAVRPPVDGTMIGTGLGMTGGGIAPSDANVLVSPTPGEGNPLPPALRGNGGGVPLPALSGLPQLAGGNPGGSDYTPEVIRGGVVTPGSDSGGGYTPEVIRGGVVTPGSDDAVGAGRGYIGAPGAAGGLRDPQAIINAGFSTQGQRAQTNIDQALSYINQGTNIFDRATRARAIAGVYNATLGPNNVGQVQGAGQDALNSALGGVSQAGIGAGASEFASTLGYAGNAERVGEAHYEAATGSEPIGSSINQTAFGPMITPVYGSRAGGMAPTPINTSSPSSGGLRVGASAREADGTYSAPGGRMVTVRGGRISAIQ